MIRPTVTLRAARPVAFQVDGEYVGERESCQVQVVPTPCVSWCDPVTAQRPYLWTDRLEPIHLGIVDARTTPRTAHARNVTDLTPKSVLTFA